MENNDDLADGVIDTSAEAETQQPVVLVDPAPDGSPTEQPVSIQLESQAVAPEPEPVLTVTALIRAVSAVQADVKAAYKDPQNQVSAWSTVGEITGTVSLTTGPFTFVIDKVVRGRADSLLRVVCKLSSDADSLVPELQHYRFMYAGLGAVLIFPASDYSKQHFLNAYLEVGLSESQQWLAHLID